jgi:hypothetical protein
VNKPIDDAVPVFYGFVPDPKLGIPVFAPFNFTKFRIVNNGEHPRVHIMGAEVNYYFDFLKTLGRIGASYTPNFPYSKAPHGDAIEDRGTFKAVLGLDTNLKLSPRLESMMVGFQFVENYIQGDKEKILVKGAVQPKQNNETVSLLLSQAFKEVFGRRLNNPFTLDFLILYDFDQAFWMQPGIRWDVGDHWRFNLYSNILKGHDDGNLPGKFGSLRSANEIFFRVTYGFNKTLK